MPWFRSQSRTREDMGRNAEESVPRHNTTRTSKSSKSRRTKSRKTYFVHAIIVLTCVGSLLVTLVGRPDVLNSIGLKGFNEGSLGSGNSSDPEAWSGSENITESIQVPDEASNTTTPLTHQTMPSGRAEADLVERSKEDGTIESTAKSVLDPEKISTVAVPDQITTPQSRSATVTSHENPPGQGAAINETSSKEEPVDDDKSTEVEVISEDAQVVPVVIADSDIETAAGSGGNQVALASVISDEGPRNDGSNGEDKIGTKLVPTTSNKTGTPKNVATENSKGQLFKGVVMDPIDNRNVTWISYMFYRIIITNSILQVGELGCGTSSPWMPATISAIEEELLGFQYHCLEPSRTKAAEMTTLYEGMTSAEVSSIRPWSDRFPAVEMVFSIGYLPELEPTRVWKVFKQMKVSGVKWAFFENHIGGSNSKALIGERGVMNVRKAPFHFDPPQRVISNISEVETELRAQLVFYEIALLRKGI